MKKDLVLKIINIVLIGVFFYIFRNFTFNIIGFSCPQEIDASLKCEADIKRWEMMLYGIFCGIEIVYFLFYKLRFKKVLLLLALANLVGVVILFIELGSISFALCFALPVANAAIEWCILKREKE